MSGGLTIYAELCIPSLLMQACQPDSPERLLEACGLLPKAATERRWRMDTDTPGAYRLTFTVTLPGGTEERRHG